MPFSVMLDYSRNTILVYVLKKLILPKIEENQIERKQTIVVRNYQRIVRVTNF